MANSSEQEGGLSEVPVQAVADHTLFLEYLCRIIPAFLEDRDSATATLKTSLVEKAHAECIKKFIGDPQTPVLLIQRSSTKGELYICELWTVENGDTKQSRLESTTEISQNKHVKVLHYFVDDIKWLKWYL